jgi:CRISPR/Cas system-associated exonuclease Cas4 (RecB family)
VKSWSVSSVRRYHSCSLAWWRRRVGAKEDFTPSALVEGIVLHEAIAEHLRSLRDGAEFPEEDAVALLRAAFFAQETGAPIRYGAKGRDEILARLETLFRRWRAEFRPDGEIVAVETELNVRLPGIDLPLLGYVDLVVRTKDGDQVIDFKSSAAKPSPDPLLDPLDLQKLALTRAWETATGRTVVSWKWAHLVKTKTPGLVDVELPVASEDRGADLARLAAVVNPTIRAMDAVLSGTIDPVPTQAPQRPCGSCGFRNACVLWAVPGGAAPAP